MPDAAPVMTTVRPLMTLRLTCSCVLLDRVADGCESSSVVGDQVENPAPRPDGQVVAHAGDRLQPGARDRPRGGRAAGRMDHPVAVAVDHQRRHVDLPRARRCGRPRRRCRELPGDARRTSGSRSQAMPACSRTHASSNGNPCEPMWRNMSHRARRPPRARFRGGFAVAIRHHVDSAGRPMRGAPVVDMIDVSVRTRPGMMRGDGLGDHAAHRDADEVRVAVAERVEQTDGVAGHVAEVVLPRGRCRRAGPPTGSAAGKLMWVDRPDVAVVEPDHPVARARRALRRNRRASVCICCPSPATSTTGGSAGSPRRVVAQLDAAADVDDRFVASRRHLRRGVWHATRRAWRAAVDDRPAAAAGRGGDTAGVRGARRRRRWCRTRTPAAGFAASPSSPCWRTRRRCNAGCRRRTESRRACPAGCRRSGRGRTIAASAKLRSAACASAMLTSIACRSGMTHSPNRIRVLVMRAVPSITGRVRCTSKMVACSRSDPPASTSSVSRVEQPRVAAQPLDRPGQRGGGGLVSRGEQREQFVGDVVVGDRRAVLVARLQHHRQYVVALVECRVPSGLGDQPRR